MKSQLYSRILTASIIGLLSTPALSQPSSAQTVTYFCGKSRDGVPTTFAHNATGKRIEVVRWQREWGGGITREERCQKVSARFKSASERGLLNYITSGRMSGEKVVCVAKEYGAPCSEILFTLKPEDNANEVVKALMGVGYRARGPVIQSDDGSPQIYIDINLLLNDKSREREE